MTTSRMTTGVPGLDEVLEGGLLPRRTYLVCGGPGYGKTTLGAHFLGGGLQAGERCLFISLSERSEQLLADVRARGLDLDGVEVLELRPEAADLIGSSESYSIFEPGVVEGPSVTQRIIDTVERVAPQRVFIDSLTHIQLLNHDSFSYHKQVASLLSFLYEKGATVVATAEASPRNPDDQLRYLCDGVLVLRREPNRSIEVVKYRGSHFAEGPHSFRLGSQGMAVFPRLIPSAHGREFTMEQMPSGVPSLDRLLHGGLDRGTVTILSGPSGVGKTTLGFQFMKEAAGRGLSSRAYVFDEHLMVLRRRCESVGLPLTRMEETGTLRIEQIEPLIYSPDELAAQIREEVEQAGVRVVMLDSVAGYRLSVRGQDLIPSLHALCKYLQNMGVTVILTNEIENLTGAFSVTGAGLSYLADTVIFMRYLELRGELIKAIGVLKKRLSSFEQTMRRFDITEYGIEVGDPLVELRGILSGIPDWVSPR